MSKRILDRVTFLLNHLDLPAATNDKDAKWDEYQIKELNYDGLLSITDKSRQLGWSWTMAALAVADACEIPRDTSIFVSINQDEATEKVRYARYIIEALYRAVRPKIIIDNRQELELQNGSRLISHPCIPVRGKAKAKVFLDEFAHYPKDREIYASAIPVTTRGGSLRVGSTPLGAAGMFWEIYDQKLQTYPGFRRRRFPWWSAAALCAKQPKDIELFTTEERVMGFGTSRIQEIFRNIPLSDFQQEYECSWQDEQEAWISWEVIKANQVLAAEDKLEIWQASSVEGAMQCIEHFADAVRSNRLERTFSLGGDIGRKKDLTEIILLGKGTQYPYRMGISLSAVPFDQQETVFDALLTRLPIVSANIDATGLGMQLAENLQRKHGFKVVPCVFTNETKELWAVDLKVAMERCKIQLPLDRELSYQIHSIKRKISESKHAVFDCAASEKHHADKFWALALAATGLVREPEPVEVMRLG